MQLQQFRLTNSISSMKKIAAILLSVFVLLLAVHPAVMFHFCSGDLASVSITKPHSMSGCCSDGSKHDMAPIFIEKYCCQNYTFELSTDDYTPQSHISQIDFQGFHHLVFLYTYATTLDRVAELRLPSEYRDRHLIGYETGRDVLSRFCVYII